MLAWLLMLCPLAWLFWLSEEKRRWVVAVYLRTFTRGVYRCPVCRPEAGAARRDDDGALFGRPLHVVPRQVDRVDGALEVDLNGAVVRLGRRIVFRGATTQVKSALRTRHITHTVQGMDEHATQWWFHTVVRLGHVQVRPLDDARVGVHKVQPLAPRDVGGPERRRELLVVRQVRAVELGIRERCGGFQAFVLLDVEQVDLPSSSRGQGLRYGEA